MNDDLKIQFASDNTAPVLPEVWEELQRADREPRFALGYGDDPVTAEAVRLIRELFETDCDVFFVFNGSAANSLALGSMTRSWHGVLCHPFSHAETDEANAPEFFTGGAKLIHVDGPAGKIEPESIPPMLERGHGIHSAKITAVTLTQATEVGAVYTKDEIRALTSLQKRPGLESLRFHMDGARFANAIATLGIAPAEATWKAGIAALSLGGAKNGLTATEALIFFDRDLAAEFEWRRKQGGQLASKMRYQAAPWIAVLRDGAWLRHASHANRCARRLGEGLASIPGMELRYPVEANAAFVSMPPAVAQALHDRGWHFYPFSVARAWRFVCNWATTDEAIDALLEDARTIVAAR
jgi:threonine aldolase